MIPKFLSHVFALYTIIISVHGRPSKYCLYPVNRTDCGGPPTPVFSYHKPGSRCEIEIWKGCPSYNRFENEASCSHFCIGRLRFDVVNEISKEEKGVGIDEECLKEYSRDDCGLNPTLVYTYNKKYGACEKEVWRGCETSNKFLSEEMCMALCMPNVNATLWQKKIEKLSAKEITKINDILDDIVEYEYVSQEEEKILNRNKLFLDRPVAIEDVRFGK